MNMPVIQPVSNTPTAPAPAVTKAKRIKSPARISMDELDKAMVSQAAIKVKIEKLQKALVLADERVKAGSAKLAKILG
jgi:hypothetical protein